MIGRIRLVVALSCVALSTLVLAPLQLVAMKTKLWSEWRILRIWHRVNLHALGFRIHQKGELTDRRPLVVAANHVSWTDISVIGSRCDVSFVAKADMARWPVMGWLSRLQRTIFVERDRKRTSGKQAGEIGRRLAEGEAIVLFAEGTTGDGNLILPFKSTLFGAATMALQEGAVDTVYIQPLTIAYTRVQGMPMGRRHRPLAAWIGDTPLAPHVRALLEEGAVDAELHFGEAVAFSAGDNRKQATRRAEAEVRAMLETALARPMKGKL
jgi:1-acyl-sn-glycerol-3-phosphate acyltransferase